MSYPKELHFASIWEHVSDIVPENIAVICGNNKKTWKDYESDSAKLASFLIERGIKENSKVGLYLHNCNEYLEAQFATFKVMGVPINVNYRYQSEELKYLLNNSDSEAVFFHGCYADQVKKIAKDLPKIKTWIQVDDQDSTDLNFAFKYEEIINTFEPMPRIKRKEENIYMIYTGGTTGMPKGVMYTHGGFAVSMFGTLKLQGYKVPDVRDRENISKLKSVILEMDTNNSLNKCLIACPLMHGTGMFLGGFLTHILGGTIITVPALGLDPKILLQQVELTKATSMVIVGDAFAKPILAELDRTKKMNDPYDISSLKILISSGVIWSAEVKTAMLEHHDMKLFDSMGSSEGGMGSSITSRGIPAKTAKFKMNSNVIVLSDNGDLVQPGSGIRGMIGTSGLVPLGYFKDPEKSAITFKEVNGTRYSFPGDYALIESDGSITLLGRGSNCINSAGEKIYPEEVEEAIKKNISVYDCLVVGIKDDRFGQKVIAVVSLNIDTKITTENIIENTRKYISSYKLPKHIILVDKIQRAPNGKADYKWANMVANENIHKVRTK